MRVQNIKISKWRNFDNLEINLPSKSPIICLVGANGVGKSQILELIAACSQHIGLTPGAESNRNSPFAEVGYFSVTFHIEPGLIPHLEDENNYPEYLRAQLTNWDRTFIVSHNGANSLFLDYGSLDTDKHPDFPRYISSVIASTTAVHYLSLDADRSYPKIIIQAHELTQVYDRDWEQTKKSSSFRSSKNLYEEWIKYFVGQENQDNGLHAQAIRLARHSGNTDPTYVDRFESYKKSVHKVLPHLLFLGVDSKTRSVRFDSTGTSLSFEQLSGGEREIAFIIGQIDRFSLRRGLLLIDEPELHLNPDLLRTWVGFLKDSVEAGQIWLATHSLDVVEVVGQSSTVIVERSGPSNQVTASSVLSGRPIISALSRSIGSPAFSISNISFVYVEGEDEVGERERYRKLCQNPPNVRFIEAGSCKEVIKKRQLILDLATASGQDLRVGGVVDRDWRSEVECRDLSKQCLHVLGVHEVENIFLHPETIKDWLFSIGKDLAEYDSLLLNAADERAGSWIFNGARSDKVFREFATPSEKTREYIHLTKWQNFSDIKGQCSSIVSHETELSSEQRNLLSRHLEVRANIYKRLRSEEGLWRRVEGKEIFKSLVRPLGFSDQDVAEQAITSLWNRKPQLIPIELTELRNYIRSL